MAEVERVLVWLAGTSFHEQSIEAIISNLPKVAFVITSDCCSSG